MRLKSIIMKKSNGQQFHQYQQNEQSPLTSNYWAQKDHEIGDMELESESCLGTGGTQV